MLGASARAAAPSLSGIVPRFQRGLAWLVEAPTAVLMVAEVVILFCGITARYVFKQPLIWSDELASILFLWLAMFGAALAVQRAGHMRLSYLVDRMPPFARAVAQVLTAATPLLFVALLVPAALDYADDQSFVETPALGWSGLVRALAIGLFVTFVVLALAVTRRGGRGLAALLLVTVLFMALAGGGIEGAGPNARWTAALLLSGFGAAVMTGRLRQTGAMVPR